MLIIALSYLQNLKCNFKNLKNTKQYQERLKMTGKNGFSLIEILISLIALSILSAALAPAMTKKIKSSYITQAEKFVDKCTTFGADCALCLGKTKCVVCYKICQTGKNLNVDTCSCN